MSEMVGDIVFLAAPPSVARKLLELGRSYPATESSSGGMEVPLSQEGLARVVGCTRETVSRAPATYRRLGRVATSRRRITIVRPDGLRRMFPITVS